MPFGDHASGPIQDLVETKSARRGVRGHRAAKRTVSALLVEEWIGHHISHLTGVEQGNDSAASTEICTALTAIRVKAPSTAVFRSANDVAPERRAAIDDALSQLNRKTEAGHSKNIFLIATCSNYPIAEMNDAPLMAHQLDPLVDVVGADTIWALWAPARLSDAVGGRAPSRCSDGAMKS